MNIMNHAAYSLLYLIKLRNIVCIVKVVKLYAEVYKGKMRQEAITKTTARVTWSLNLNKASFQ